MFLTNQRRCKLKHGKRPTRAQKIRLTKVGLNPDNWLVITDHNKILTVVNRESKKTREIGGAECQKF